MRQIEYHTYRDDNGPYPCGTTVLIDGVLGPLATLTPVLEVVDEGEDPVVVGYTMRLEPKIAWPDGIDQERALKTLEACIERARYVAQVIEDGDLS